jgi:SEC-C motif-containing protein
LHEAKLQANSAEQLMRSRYSAFCIGDINYLITTLHPDYRSKDDEAALRQTIQQTQWLGLKIIKHVPGIWSATVEFVAFYGMNPIQQMHELSRFIRQEGKWFYTNGDMLAPVKLSRNAGCFCGSAKKFKKCHGQ